MRFLSISIILLSLVFLFMSCGKTEDEIEKSSTDNSSNSDNQIDEYLCNKKIKIDGKNLDWNGINSIMTDNSNDGGNYNSLDIKELFLINDSKHACLRIDRMGIQRPSGEHLNFWIYFNKYSQGGKSFAVSVFHNSNQQVNPVLWDTTGTNNYDEYTRLDENILYNTSTSSMEIAWSLEKISMNSKYIISFYTHHTDNKTWYHNGDWSDSSVVFSFLPEVISTLPSNNEFSVNVSDNISIIFSKSMDNTSITTNIHDNKCTGTIQISSDNFSTCLQMSSNPKSSNSNKTFSLNPKNNLSYSTNYKIRVEDKVKDATGQSMMNQFETINGFTTKTCNPTCSGLVAHYTFNGNSLNSASDNYHAITKDNSTQPNLVSDRNGNSFSSYKFDGVNDYLVVDNTSGLEIEKDSFSFVTWISIDGFNGYDFTASDGRTWGGSLIFASDLNNMTNLGWGRWDDMQEKTGMYSFNVDNATTWHTNYLETYLHIAGIFNKDLKKLKYYVYGKKKEEKEWSGNYLLPVTKFHFGTNANKSKFGNLRIDDFQIYNKALSQLEVNELYQNFSNDNYPPNILETFPPDIQSYPFYNGIDNITITFSETIDNKSVYINSDNDSCYGSIQVSSDNFSSCAIFLSEPLITNSQKTYTFYPKDNLTQLQIYKIRITKEIKDIFENNLKNVYESRNGFIPEDIGVSLSYANYNDNTTFNITVSEGKFEILNVNTEKTPTLGLKRGFTYHFNLNDTSTNNHPFIITTSSSGGSFNDEYTNGVSNNRATTGILTFQVPSDAPSTLYYNCGIHSGMGGMIKINP